MEDVVQISDNKLEGDLVIPSDPKSIILFAHGAGSDRHSTRNQYVARLFNREGFATLLVDLLNPQEKGVDEKTKHFRFDIDLLAERLLSVTKWIIEEPRTRGLKIGYFGSSTGAAAALISAARLGDEIGAIVSRGGRPDLAVSKADLHKVSAATLFVVGGDDAPVIGLNRSTMKLLSKASALDMAVIPGAGHLFEEATKMEEVARVAADWFGFHLAGTGKKFENRYRPKKGALLGSLFKEMPHFQIRFKDRTAAGDMLASLLREYKNDREVVVVGIARGGVVVADQVARKLNASLGFLISKRLRAPDHSEKAIGAILHNGYTYLDQHLVESMGISEEYIALEKSEQMSNMKSNPDIVKLAIEREEIGGKKVILLDDGAATGATITAAARWLKKQNSRLIVVGVPIAPKEVATTLAKEADKIVVISIISSSKFGAVEQYYDDFSPVSDSTILKVVNQTSVTEL